MHPHTKFEISTSKNIGDMHWTGSRTDGLMDGRGDGQCDYHTPPKVPLGHRKQIAANPVCISSTSSNKALIAVRWSVFCNFGIKMNVEMFPKF